MANISLKKMMWNINKFMNLMLIVQNQLFIFLKRGSIVCIYI